jgi:hypothetical protein
MIENFQIKGLERLINSSVIKDIYPMVDHVELVYDVEKQDKWRRHDHLDINIFLNDSTITKENMYDKEFDPHYLVEHHIKSYFPYFDLKNIAMDFIVWGPDENIIYSWKN